MDPICLGIVQMGKKGLELVKVYPDTLPKAVLDELQARAVEDGMPYQTLISSILHRFITGRLIEKPRSNKSLE